MSARCGVRYRANAVSIACAVSLLACRGEPEKTREGGTGGVALPSAGLLASVPLGDFAGATPNTVATHIANPYHGQTGAVAEGEDLFVNMNCAGCHGYTLAGGMGPNLVDTYWRYGGSPAEIYKSIYEGRPRGMPAWGASLPPQQIWKIVAYIEAQGGAFPASAAEAGRQGNRANQHTDAASSLKGIHDDH